MSFWAHLDALRKVLVRIAIVLAVLAVVFFAFMPWIFDHVITAPCNGSFPIYRMLGIIKGDGQWLPDLSGDDFHVELINIELASQFFVHMSASWWAAFVVGFPIIIYLLWGFVAPGLYPQERKGARKAFLFGNVMFYLGMAVGYFIVFPVALRFLADYQLSDKIANTVSLTSYMDTFYTLVLMMGLLFELPLLAWMLGRMGILKRSFFNRYRKYAIVAILVLAAIVTPTSDIFTLAIVIVPIYALWEASALLIKKSP
ncbi:MAG: twin-arginine translocase subunit TatC [Muribaculaceae bacterium]|nr:twin-arginine translocase subunit TatC [Muribaculaceae bacterium]